MTARELRQLLLDVPQEAELLDGERIILRLHTNPHVFAKVTSYFEMLLVKGPRTVPLTPVPTAHLQDAP